MTAQRRKQVKEVSEKNLRISAWRWNPFHKMCMFTLQGPTGLATYSVSILFNRTLIWVVGRWCCVFSHSQLRVAMSWPMKHTGRCLGSWAIYWKLACPFWLALPSYRRGVWPWGWPTSLATTSQFEPGKADKAQRQKGNDIRPGFLGDKMHSWFMKATVYSRFSLCAAKQNPNW